MDAPSTTSRSHNDLIYQVNDRPTLKDTLFAAVQHLLAIFVAIITPPLIIADALSVDPETRAYLISMALFASGIATIVQCRRIGPVGAGLLCIQGTSFSFIGPIISAGLAGGLPLVFGCTIAAAPVEMVVSRLFKYVKHIVTPIVSGTVVLLIGLCLIKVGVIACGGGQAALHNGSLGSAKSLSVAGIVLATIVLLNRTRNKYLRMSSVVIGIIVGYLLSVALGMVDFSILTTSKVNAINVPTPFKYGLSIEWGSLVAFGVIYLITAIEASGDVTANSMISGLEITGDQYVKRVSGGVLADGVNSLLAGVFNSFPNSIFAQNNGIIQLTGVASRYVGYFIAGMLILLGLFPHVGLIFSIMPDPVLGGATLLMFGTVAAAGIRILSSQNIDRNATIVIALSLSFGLGVELVPDILNGLPASLHSVFASGISTGGLVAIISNALLRKAS